MKIKLKVSYDGTNYHGWQVQPGKVTVQETIEQAISTITGEKVRVTGSGRTDAGVHAEGQVASFEISKSSVPEEKFSLALNTVLPPDIRVLESSGAKKDFHPVKSAKKKTYVYKTYRASIENPLKERYAIKISPKINVEKMREASSLLIGEHDFKAFSSSGSSVKTTIRKILSIEIEEKEQEICFYVTGNGFLYNMVRIIVGTLIKIGEGKADKNVILKAFSSKKKDELGKTLPAKGLTLKSVIY